MSETNFTFTFHFPPESEGNSDFNYLLEKKSEIGIWESWGQYTEALAVKEIDFTFFTFPKK